MACSSLAAIGRVKAVQRRFEGVSQVEFCSSELRRTVVKEHRADATAKDYIRYLCIPDRSRPDLGCVKSVQSSSGNQGS